MDKKKWTADDIEDQTGRIAIVTGSSSGIGFETARALAEKKAKVIIAVRDLVKGTKAIAKIMDKHPRADLELMELDLSDLESVRKFAAEFRNKFDRLDLLINNAGVMVPPYTKTKDGFELQFGTNHLGHFALTGLLIDIIEKTPGSRIVNVSSTAHKFAKPDFDDLNWEKNGYKKWQAYGNSKIANLYFTYELQRKLTHNGSGTIVTAAHPGWTGTDLQRHTGLASFLNTFFAQTIEMGALPTLYAACAPDVKGSDYYGPKGFNEMKGYPVKVTSNELSHNMENARRLWQISEEMTDVKFGLEEFREAV